MNVTELKLQYDICENSGDGLPVIIVAAGKSVRMGGINKQFLSLLGIPVIARTLMAFESCKSISKIILVTSKENVADMQIICEKYLISKLTDIVIGGKNRHESVVKGIERLDKSDLNVLIHDGARPLVDGNIISEVADALKLYDASLCVNKINDTVKKVDSDGRVITTVNRDMLYAAQTPQGVNVEKYKKALEKFENTNEFTDDASVMEKAGCSVKAIIGSAKNIKITTPEDIIIAEGILKGESGICE